MLRSVDWYLILLGLLDTWRWGRYVVRKYSEKCLWRREFYRTGRERRGSPRTRFGPCKKHIFRTALQGGPSENPYTKSERLSVAECLWLGQKVLICAVYRRYYWERLKAANTYSGPGTFFQTAGYRQFVPASPHFLMGTEIIWSWWLCWFIFNLILSDLLFIFLVKVSFFPLQAWAGPWGSGRLRLRIFSTFGTM
jgi:hypothetical protein